jgi:hypothetical protein
VYEVFGKKQPFRNHCKRSPVNHKFLQNTIVSDLVIIGTHAVAERTVYVSVRVINSTDNLIETDTITKCNVPFYTLRSQHKIVSRLSILNMRDRVLHMCAPVMDR